MYEFIEGEFVVVEPTYIVVNCSGVGYRAEISLNSYSLLKQKNQGRVLTTLIVREDMQLLYGFASTTERDLFKLLISVSSIGANTARMILSSLSIEELVIAIRSNDSKTICKVKGVGAKTAQRVCIDLHDKLDSFVVTDGDNQTINPALNNKIKEQALLALQTLGFNKVIIEKTLNKILENNTSMSVEQLVKEALKRM